MGCSESKEKEQPVAAKEANSVNAVQQRPRSPTPDKEIAEAGTLFSLMPTDANDVEPDA
jgi:hypothetical protein